MPYIQELERSIFKEGLALIKDAGIAHVGELNYLITSLCKQYDTESGRCYKTLNEIIGVLECAKQEFYRKTISPYEDRKEKENGDV